MIPSRPAALLLGVVILLLLCGGCQGVDASASAPPPSVPLPASLPAELPVPDGATVRPAGDVAVIVVADTTPGDVGDFYREGLPAAGWEVTDEWSGVDPHGRATVGLVVVRDGRDGALAIIDAGEGAVEVQANFHQPAATTG